MRLSLVALTLAVAAASPARAQYNGYEGYGGYLDTRIQIGQMAVHTSIMQNIARQRYDAGRAARGASAPAPVPAGFQTTFVRQPEVTRRTHQGIVEQAMQRDARSGAHIRDVLARTNMAANFDRGMAQYGLRSNDVVDAMTGYWLTAWGIANGITEPAQVPTAPQVRAVRAQIAGVLSRTEVARFTPALRQQLADEAIVNQAMLESFWEDRTPQGRANFARIGEVTRQAFLGFGADLRTLRVTDQGFVQR